MSQWAYELLEPLAPFIGGEMRWIAYACVAAPLGAVAWAWFGRRWQPDGIRRCPRCGHRLDPSAAFEDPGGIRCPECGVVASCERRTLRRAGRRRLAAAGLLAAVAAALPLLAWHGVHVFLARSLLPRWVTAQRADFPGGLVMVEEVDPVQAWFGWFPNPADGAWQGNFFDTPEGAGLGGAGTWPERARLRAWIDPRHPAVVGRTGPFSFGAVPDPSLESGRMPPVGSPGFGSDIDGDGSPDVVVGQVNVGSAGGIDYWLVELPEAGADQGAPPRAAGIGLGRFVREPSGSWAFLRRCHGFRYALVPGYAMQDPEIPCTWDAAAHAWRPDARRARRPADRARLAASAERAAQAHAQCAGDASPDDGTPGGFLRCPGLIAAMSEGVVELVVSGHGSEWEGWVLRAWPAGASPELRALYLDRMRRAIDESECGGFLRALNGWERASGDAGGVPRGSLP